jgi:hypothetical protein
MESVAPSRNARADTMGQIGKRKRMRCALLFPACASPTAATHSDVVDYQIRQEWSGRRMPSSGWRELGVRSGGWW